MEIDLNLVVQQYIELRDRVQAEKDEMEKRVAPMKAAMEKIEGVMSGLLERQGLSSMSTPAGTVVRSKWTKTVIQDWDALTKYIKDNDRFDLLEKRVAKINALDVINEEGGLPGVGVETGYNVQIRRK